MKKIKDISYAKINLTLEIIELRDDGYHNIETIMHKINLYDIIEISLTGGTTISINMDKGNIPLTDNIIYKTAILMAKKLRPLYGVSIKVNKNIPFGSGLGGGSSNSATVIKLLNSIWNGNLTFNELKEIADKVGSDVPFFLYDDAVYCKEKGNIVNPLGKIKSFWIILAIPPFEIKAKEAYRLWDEFQEKEPAGKSKILAKKITKTNPAEWVNYMINHLEKPVISNFLEMKKVVNLMQESNALKIMMSGSGGCIFGLYENKEKAETDLKKIKYPGWQFKIISSVRSNNEK